MNGTKQNTAYIALGANIGEPRENMRLAVRMLRESGDYEVMAVSSLYRTRPVGVIDQPDFLNAVIEAQTHLSPRELLGLCGEIETKLGRERTIRWGPRVIDIDVLLYDDVRIDEDTLQIPHPRMLERAFVMVPLAEIAPDLELNGTRASDIADGLDRSGIEKIEDRSWSD